ncbi:nucleoside 2-deoxyribosyltransferase [Lactobacillus sp. DCY120]|uniref:Nucleoside 2-deoxyribosyltransferase n=1 Tax=Bombilactobacillus apium TaxID=2675299 RepID=A0A850QY69_9LACO|nr:nucleoside 2-deoxyribosyltransferase [Bombilactobacillus apium]NVY95603.1 nucleoside 2-deoxyribosyltransferase [Bombilactobacillus apium]
MNQRRIYLACSWFSPEEVEFLQQGQQALRQNTSIDWDNSFRPLEHQFQDLDVQKHPEAFADPLWQMGTFQNDLLGINAADLVCGLFLPQKPDSGMAFEFGYAYASHKPIIAVIPDTSTEPINLMLVPSVTRYIRISELANFDFNHLDFALHAVSVY